MLNDLKEIFTILIKDEIKYIKAELKKPWKPLRDETLDFFLDLFFPGEFMPYCLFSDKKK